MKSKLFFFIFFIFCIANAGYTVYSADISEQKQAVQSDDASSGLPEKIAVSKGSRPGPGVEIKETKRYFGHKVSLDFEEAHIKNVFRLLSEVSGVNIVAGEDVKGSVTVHIKNVPWDQALETILETNGLGMKRMGNVIAVFPLEKIKKAEEERLKEDIAQGRKTQISIEARIISTTKTYSRQLGVQWGYGWRTDAGSYLRGGGGLMPAGLTAYPGGIGVITNNNIGSSYLVNLANSYTASPTIGLLVGGANAMLDVQLSALEGTGDVKVISSPKVTTLDNVKAYIKQGTAIPIITRSTATEPAKVEYKDAVLQLTVTPSITPDGRLSLKILATNDSPDYATQTAQKLDNPPINKSEVESTVLVRDGETIVVGGIRKTTDSEGGSGVPGLSKIPVLGWLFKSENIAKDLSEMLIFLTPRIVPDAGSVTAKP